MLTTRNAAHAAANSIAAARSLRQQRRARTAEEEILGLTHPGPAKPNRRQRRSASTKASEPPVPAPAEEQEQIQQDPGPEASISSKATVRPADSNDQPQAVDPSSQPQPQIQWWGPVRNDPVPNPFASIAKPTKSLFASGVPTTKPEIKPLEGSQFKTSKLTECTYH
ncbi:hypothetical protein PTTG_06980 [Puccinia triticina 1-1 BBBD Race 1]|uniref:Uncharacterized protein n=1 Tax=Puccinia triticina (isolate 1-1 / race 1 (BBBD)) TaxID=630390 RepID=A0A180G8A4_PUCT1|nr:hypothetical protein PTTG_06980 [Puccinia triticina 1-1 BBBD Race 1]